MPDHPSSQSDYPGAIKGEFGVDQNGNAVYSIPIQVPPGTGGLAPSISLVYHSALNNGMLGPGWSLQGLSAILRAARNPAQDRVRVKESLHYDASDRLVLDGLRLIAVEGAYGTPSAVYHTEIQTWKKVTATGEGFLSRTGDGVHSEFGLTGDSQIRTAGPGSPIRAWLLNRVEDACGNFITFHYQGDPKTTAYYPLRIAYTGNQGLAPARAVEFLYEDRPDIQPRYESGCATHETRRLRQIKTSVDGQAVLTYTLDYRQGAASGRSLVSQVTLSDAQGRALPPTRFDWLDLENHAFAASQPLSDPKVKFGLEVIPFDFDGNGRRDLLLCEKTDAGRLVLHLMMAGGDSGYLPPVTQSFPELFHSPGCIHPVDIDGDGATELIHVGQRENHNLAFTLLRATRGPERKIESGPVGAAGPDDIRGGGKLIPLDIDGDGCVDLVYCSGSDSRKLRLQPLVSNGSRFKAGEPVQTSLPFDSATPLLGVDFDGSGLTSLLHASSEECGGRACLKLRVLTSNGQTFEVQDKNPLGPDVKLPFGGALIPARLKDDGQDDLIYTVSDDDGRLVIHTLFGSGVDYRLSGPQPLRTDIRYTGWILPMAMRGAGLMELLVVAQDAQANLDLRMLRWNGTGFLPPESCAPGDRARKGGGWTMPADVHGNGKTDLIYVSSRDDRTLDLRLLAAPPTVPDRVRSITDGLNARYEIEYRPLTDPAVYSKDDLPVGPLVDGCARLNASISGAAWPMKVQASLVQGTPGSVYSLPTRQFAEYVVARYTISDGKSSYRFDYQYRGCRIDPSGRGWLGFSSRELRDATAGTTQREQYHQVFPATAAIEGTTLLETSTGALLRKESNSYHARVQNGAHRHDLVGVRNEHFTPGKPSPDVIENETSVLDDFGNVTCNSIEPSGGVALHALSEYDNDPKDWWIGRLRSRATSADSSGRSVLKKETFVYDPRTGKVAESSIFDDENNRWLTTRYVYDPFGNPISVTDPSGAVTRTEYDARHHTFPVREILPAGGGGDACVLQREFSAAFGVKIATVDANGVRDTFDLDGLGRLIEVRGVGLQSQTVALARMGWGVDDHGYYSEQKARTSWNADQWSWERTYLDGLGRVYRKTSLAADGNREVVVERTLDQSGNPLCESLPRFPGTEPQWIEHLYDILGREIRRVEPADSGRRITEIAFPRVNVERTTVSSSGSEPRTSIREFSMFGSQSCAVKSTDPCGAATVSEYDALGRVTKATDPAGVSTTSRYNSLGRRVEMWVSDARKTFAGETVANDTVKGTIRISTTKGNDILLEHDQCGRLVKRTVTAQGGSPSVTTYEYGGAAPFGKDRLTRVIMPEGMIYAYAYDARGNIARQDVTIDGRTWSIERSYTPGRAAARFLYPDGAQTDNAYGASGALEASVFSMDSAKINVATYSLFDPHGRACEIVYANGLRESLRYNPLGQLKSQALAAPSKTLAQTEFQWDGFHSLARVEDKINSERTQSFSYDPAGRLVRAIRHERAQDFTYDAGGNLKSKSGVTYSYEGHQLVEGRKQNQVAFRAQYDLDGCMSSVRRGSEADEYRYDALGQLVAARNAEFRYDHSGKRLVKKSKDVTTYYIAPDFEVAVFASGATQTTKYVQGPHGAVAQITHQSSGDSSQWPVVEGVPAVGVAYFHRNLINSTSVQTDESGAISATVEYEPFGEFYSFNSFTGRDTFRSKFAGKELDRETGLYYFHSRYYDPSIGRFVSFDDRPGGQFGAPDALNRYAYVLNNPVTGIDFDGHFRWDVFADVMIGIAAVTLMAAATVATGGAALPLAGSILFGAAVSGIWYSAKHGEDDFKWSEWGIQVGIGAATGAVSGAAAGAAARLGAMAYVSLIGGIRAAAYVAAGMATEMGISLATQVGARAAQLGIAALAGAAGGMASSYLSAGLSNISHGKEWNDNWDTTLWQGAVKGAITGLASGTMQAWIKPRAQDWSLWTDPGAVYGPDWVISWGVRVGTLAASAGGLVAVADYLMRIPPKPDQPSPLRTAPPPLQFTHRGLVRA
jgi:RHS repeat-associated protein